MAHREPHPKISIGLFFIVLGLALLAATTDVLHLGSPARYFTWQTVLIFIGVLLLVNLHFTGGVLMIAGGFWFLLDQFYSYDVPQYVRTLYWPGVIIVLGVAFIVSSLVKRHPKEIK
ncbi:MAG TPA: DUF5668 domain-containing protein [Bacteroidales bacterium]|nr:DUF5668 domain-containing protein [Bacteroidales bacterium]